MEHPPVPGAGRPVDESSVTTLLDPQRYLREADLALLYGSREDAIALIAQAYLAFDLVAAECHSLDCHSLDCQVTVHSERNS